MREFLYLIVASKLRFLGISGLMAVSTYSDLLKCRLSQSYMFPESYTMLWPAYLTL
jgi:hypothetical protein